MQSGAALWTTCDLLMLVQTIHKCGFIEWHTIGKRLRNNPYFSQRGLGSPEMISACELEFNQAFRTFSSKTHFFSGNSSSSAGSGSSMDLQTCLRAFAQFLVDERQCELETELSQMETEILLLASQTCAARKAFAHIEDIFGRILALLRESGVDFAVDEGICKQPVTLQEIECELQTLQIHEPLYVKWRILTLFANAVASNAGAEGEKMRQLTALYQQIAPLLSELDQIGDAIVTGNEE